MKTLIITIFFLFGQVSFACDKPVSYLLKGTTTRCDGYLFSPEKEKEVREYAIKFEDMKKLSIKQDGLVQTLTERVYNANVQNVNLRKILESEKSQNNLERIIYFTLGTVIGLGIGKVLSR